MVGATYYGDNFGLDSLVQGNKAKVENEVELKTIISQVVSIFCFEDLWILGLRRTEETRRRTERVCCARVMVKVECANREYSRMTKERLKLG